MRRRGARGKRCAIAFAPRLAYVSRQHGGGGSVADWLNKARNLFRKRPVVAVLRLHGAIAAGGRGLNDAALAGVVERAFSRRGLSAVALSINSPGGSPAQSALIAARIRRKAEEKGVPVIAFCEDVAASGGYWLACAADEIYADRASLVGSIGVIFAGFGFQEAIAKLGVERRVHTAGEHKMKLDPFQPETEADRAFIDRLKGQMHEIFIDHVRERRGERLTGAVFDGSVWLAEDARAHGLIDGIGHLVPEMKRRFGDQTRFMVVSPKKPLLRRLGLPSAAEALGALEERAGFARWGL